MKYLLFFILINCAPVGPAYIIVASIEECKGIKNIKSCLGSNFNHVENVTRLVDFASIYSQNDKNFDSKLKKLDSLILNEHRACAIAFLEHSRDVLVSTFYQISMNLTNLFEGKSIKQIVYPTIWQSFGEGTCGNILNFEIPNHFDLKIIKEFLNLF